MPCINCGNTYFFDFYERPNNCSCVCNYEICEKCIKDEVYRNSIYNSEWIDWWCVSVKCFHCNQVIYKHKWYNYIADIFDECEKHIIHLWSVVYLFMFAICKIFEIVI